MQAELNEEEQLHPRLKHFKQRKREIKCAVYLAGKLQPFIDNGGDVLAFKEGLKAEAQELGSSAFGSTLLYTIGGRYIHSIGICYII